MQIFMKFLLVVLFFSCSDHDNKKKFDSLAEGKWLSASCLNFGDYFGKIYAEVVGRNEKIVFLSYSDSDCTTFNGLKNSDGELVDGLYEIFNISNLYTFSDSAGENFFGWKTKASEDESHQYYLLYREGENLYVDTVSIQDFPGLDWSEWESAFTTFSQNPTSNPYGAYVKVESRPPEIP